MARGGNGKEPKEWKGRERRDEGWYGRGEEKRREENTWGSEIDKRKEILLLPEGTERISSLRNPAQALD